MSVISIVFKLFYCSTNLSISKCTAFDFIRDIFSRLRRLHIITCLCYNHPVIFLHFKIFISRFSISAPPTFIQDLPDIRGAARDAPFISFECNVECEPLCEIRWMRDGDPISNSELYIVRNKIIPEDVINNKFRSVISYLQFNMTAWPGRRLERDRDRANYTCYTTGNSVGDGISSTMLFLVECE